MTILLIEDNEPNRILATFLLEEAGHKVIQATTGQEGLARARAPDVELILLDIQLPDIDGYEIITKIRKEPQLSHIPIVAVTSFAMAGERKKAMDLGCIGYIEKPIDVATFAQQITAHLAAHKGLIKILIVDDRPEAAIILEENLAAAGYQFASAHNGTEALTRLRAEKFDLVVSDLLMPNMDGYQLCHAVKTDDQLKHIPVLIYTATYTDPKDRALAMILGADGYVVKPAEMGPFLKEIRQTIDRAAHGQLPPPPIPTADEAVYLKAYTERLVHKLEDKVAEVEVANQKLRDLNTNLEEKVKQATGQLRATVDQLNSFASAVSHDLRAPLRAIQSYSRILLSDCEGLVPQSTIDMQMKVIGAANRMDRLIQDVLALSQMTVQDVKTEPVDVEVMVRGIVEERPELQQPQADIQIASPLLPMQAQDTLLIQCMVNLLSNAVKFVAPGVKPQVHIWTEALGEASDHMAVNSSYSPQRVRLWIEDNGIGIAKEAQDRLFGMFERLNHSYEGTGLGLSIVRKAVERMGGQVGVESEPGKGSRFWLELAGVLEPVTQMLS